MKPLKRGGVHLSLLAASRRGASWTCTYCGGEKASLICERCGHPFHDVCHWKYASSKAERRVFKRMDERTSRKFIFLCRWCRS